jgi:penicillin-binding protein 2
VTGAQPVVRVGRRINVDRVAVLAMVGIAMGLTLVARLWYLQIATGEDARQRADTNRLRVETTKPLRGIIYDRGGQVLARNVSSFTASVRVTDLPKDRAAQDAVFARLGAIIALAPEDVRAAVEPGRADPFTPVRVRAPITRDQALILEEQHTSLPGVLVRFTPVRAYPEGLLLGQVMGYVGPIPPAQAQSRIAEGYARDDVIGLAGVEASYEAELRGVSGRQQVQVDAMGRVTSVLETLAPVVPGANLVLSIDVSVQRAGATALARAMARARSPQGALVALDPKGGEVLALVGLPGYDDNRFATGISQADYARLAEDPWRPMFPHAIGGQFPPGSTFKMVVVAAALQEKVVTPQANVNCTGSLTRNGLVFRDWTPHGHGPVNARQALGVSCDVYFYSVAGGNPLAGLQGLGMARLATYARAFGFGEKLGIRLPGEAPGLVPTAEWKRQVRNEAWYVGDDYNAGIGQGDVLATPLQLASMTAALANGGTLYRPRVVRELRDTAGRAVKTYPPEVIRTVPVDAAHLAAIRAGMHDTTNAPLIVPGFAGTAYSSLRAYGLDMAGKTGTAEFEGPRDAKGNLPTHALFVGYAPYQDPRIAVAVFLYGGGEGSEAAALVASEVIRSYLIGPRSITVE